MKRHNWHVMNNCYYIDDRTGMDREIDIVAYKVKDTKDVLFYYKKKFMRRYLMNQNTIESKWHGKNFVMN